MLKPEIRRVAREILRLTEGLARLRLLDGITEFKSLDNQGDLVAANLVLKAQAETVIFTKNRVANALKAHPEVISCIENDYGYTMVELKNDFLPLVAIAEQLLTTWPNITRAQVDALILTQPEMLTDATPEDIS